MFIVCGGALSSALSPTSTGAAGREEAGREAGREGGREDLSGGSLAAPYMRRSLTPNHPQRQPLPHNIAGRRTFLRGDDVPLKAYSHLPHSHITPTHLPGTQRNNYMMYSNFLRR